jgi:hypothetical protein
MLSYTRRKEHGRQPYQILSQKQEMLDSSADVAEAIKRICPDAKLNSEDTIYRRAWRDYSRHSFAVIYKPKRGKKGFYGAVNKVVTISGKKFNGSKSWAMSLV